MATSSGIDYEFLAPGRIIFGWGRRREVGALAQKLGRRAFLVWGSRTLRAAGLEEEIKAALRAAGVEPITIASISREPLVTDVDEAAVAIRSRGPASGDMLLAIGGGSAIDLAKGIAVLATHPERDTVRDFLEGVGPALPFTAAPLPIIAMPTTAGTGAEATKNGVISSIDPPFKKSLRSESLIPRVALVDPELTVSSPPAITAASGMDAITQLIESYISRRARPIPQALAIDGLKLAVPALAEAVRNPSTRPAREAMSQAALLSGMALANSGLGMAHGVAAALGAQLGVAHGLACAVMLPVALRVNRNDQIWRLAQLASAIGVARDSEAASADAFIERMERLATDVGIPRHFSEIGVERQHLPALVAGSRGGSMDGNPRPLSDAELSDILEAAL